MSNPKVATVMSEKLKQQIWDMDPGERITLLTMSVLEQGKGAVDPIIGLIDLAARMSAYLGKDKRYRIAERLRSVADHCELTSTFDEVQS